MITICWAAKGGSGTTVVAGAAALARPDPTLLVDLAGDLPAVLGLPDHDGPGAIDWLRSAAPVDRLHRLEVAIDAATALLPTGQRIAPPVGLADSSPHPNRPIASPARWQELASRLAADGRAVLIDAGTAPPPPELLAVADHRWLVTRACYLSLRAAVAQQVMPNGIVLVVEPGRSLRRSDIEVALGAPVVVEVLVDPAIARAVDAGLLASRVPAPLRRRLREAA